jgi:hypothetical protein
MKRLSLFAAVPLLWLLETDCNRKADAGKLKGRLEITGICMNYTIKVLEGYPGTGAMEANWTDEVTGIQYENVFRLGNPCSFPASLKKGDEFYFSIDTSVQKPCTVCLAYYPTPSKTLSVKVIE